ncbi:TrmH family RNA methyltransferase [Candidatus Omnitrophota bacterium]
MPFQNLITSLYNPKIKNVIKLRDKQTRQRLGFTIIEGNREISRAEEAGVTFEEVYFCRECLGGKEGEAVLATVTSRSNASFEVTKEVFQKLAYGDRLEGIMVVARPAHYTLSDISLSKNPLLVVLENVEKPGNIGAIARTCDAAGVDGLLVCDSAGDVYNPNVIRASIGTVFSVNVVQTSSEEALRFLKQNNITICATSPHASFSYTDAKFSVSVALVFGSEQDGLGNFWLQYADKQVLLPMRGKADSLNVSSTVAILIFEALRQRNQSS